MQTKKFTQLLCAAIVGTSIVFAPCEYSNFHNNKVYAAYQQWQGKCVRKTTAYTNSGLTKRQGVEYVSAGDVVTVLGEEGNAYYVSYPTRTKNKERWVAKSAIAGINTNVVTAVSRNTTTSNSAAASYAKWQGKCAKRTTAYHDSALTIRQGVEYVGAGDIVTVLGEEGNAYYVSYPLTRGGTKERWVAKSAISKVAESTAASTSSAFVTAVNRAVEATKQSSYQQWQGKCVKKSTAYTNSGLTKRQGVEYVSVGDVVTVLGEEGNAYYVSYPTRTKNKERWVAKSAISKISNTSSNNSSSIAITESEYLWPVESYKITCIYYYKDGSKHDATYSGHPGFNYSNAIDVSTSDGTPVRATASGTVVVAKNSSTSYGNRIIIKHDDNSESLYAHLSKINVSLNQRVSQGDVIGSTGHSGGTNNNSGRHLHFAITSVDPWVYFRDKFNFIYQKNCYSNNKNKSDIKSKDAIQWLDQKGVQYYI